MKSIKSSKGKLFLALALSIIIPAMTLCGIYYEISTRSVAANARSVYTDMLTQSAGMVDKELENIVDMAAVYANTNWVRTITFMQNGKIDYSRLDVYTLTQYAEIMKRVENESMLVNRTAIVFADKDISVSREGSWATMSLFMSEMTRVGMSPGDMKAYITSNTGTSYLYPLSEKDNSIYVISKLPYFTESINVQYVARISRSSLSGLLNHTYNAETAVYAPDGTLLTSATDSIVRSNLTDGEVRIDGTDYLVFTHTSPRNGWKYVCCVPSEHLFSAVSRIRFIVTMICSSLIILSAVVAVYITRRIYKPIENLGQTALEYVPRDAIRSDNIMDVLEDAYRFLHGKSDAMTRQMTAFEPLAREAFFFKLICGAIPQENILSLAAMVGVNLTGSCWVCALFDYEPSLDAAVEKKLRDNCEGYTVHVKMGTILLIESPDDVGECVSAVRKLAASIGTPVGISDAHAEISGLTNAFIEASIALEFAGTSGAATYAETTRMTGIDFEYSQNNENAYVNMLRSSDYDGAVRFMNEQIEKANRTGSLTVRCLMYNLLSTISKVCHMDNLIINEYADEYAPLDNIENFRKMLMHLTRAVCRAEKEHVAGKNDLSAEMLLYIKAEYRDAQLSLASVAEHFDVTPQHASKVFKEGCGMNFLDTLTRLRVDQAQILLKDETLTLEQVARMSGFDNAITFRRAFKKLEGILPSVFRQTVTGNAVEEEEE